LLTKLLKNALGGNSKTIMVSWSLFVERLLIAPMSKKADYNGPHLPIGTPHVKRVVRALL